MCMCVVLAWHDSLIPSLPDGWMAICSGNDASRPSGHPPSIPSKMIIGKQASKLVRCVKKGLYWLIWWFYRFCEHFPNCFGPLTTQSWCWRCPVFPRQMERSSVFWHSCSLCTSWSAQEMSLFTGVLCCNLGPVCYCGLSWCVKTCNSAVTTVRGHI